MATEIFIGWEDISVVLVKPDQNFAQSKGWAYNATGGEMSSADGGKTWNFTTLHIPETRPR